MTSVIIGRGAEQTRLHELVGEVAAGRGRSVLVEGEPGIGKSSLIAAGIEGAAALGCRVLRGAADEFVGRFPLRVLLDCFAGYECGDVAALVRGEWGGVASGSYDPVLAAMERLLEAVDKLCAESPVVLAVDDLQWADEASLTVWGQLSRSVSQRPLLLVAGSRPAPQRAELAGLRRVLESGDGVLIGLGPLDRQETAALISDLTGAPPGPRLTQVLVQAGGNPLYVRELVDVLVREGRAKVKPGVAVEVERDGQIPVPVSLRATVAGRIGSMSEATQQIVRMAALLGPEFSVAELATLFGHPVPELAEAMMEAYQASVLVDSGERTAFRHPLIRQVLYEAVPAGLRAALHRQAAQALAGAGVPVDPVADQLAASGVMDSWAVGWLVDNGAALVDRASQPVIDLLVRAAGQVPQADPRREVIESWVSMALSRMMRDDELERWARAALAREGTSAEHRLEMSCDLALAQLYSDQAEAEWVLREALAYDIGGRWGAKARAVYALIVQNRHLEDPYPAIRDAYAAAERTGDRLALGLTLHAEGYLYSQKNLEKAASLARRGIEVLEGDPQAVSWRMIMLSNYVWTVDAMSRMEEGDAAFAEMLALGRKYPSGRSQIPVHVCAAQRHYHTGHWDDALAEVEAAGELRLEHGFYAVVGLSVATLIAGHRDNRVTAAARLRTLDQMPISDVLFRHQAPWLVLARALAAERDGQPEQALEALAPMLDTGPDYDIGDRFRWTPELVRIALAVGERDAAEQAARLADVDVERERLPLRVAAAGACRGLLAGDPVPLLEAAELYRGGRRVLERGLALENAAVLLAGRDQASEARDTLAAAMEEYTTLAAHWDMTRAEARMRPFGIRLAQRARAGRAAARPGGGRR